MSNYEDCRADRLLAPTLLISEAAFLTACLPQTHDHKSRGFSLIELIAAVIILGILSAIALRKLVDLTNETLEGAVQSVAGSLGSASAINYAAFVANSGKAGVQRLNAANVCTEG